MAVLFRASFGGKFLKISDKTSDHYNEAHTHKNTHNSRYKDGAGANGDYEEEGVHKTFLDLSFVLFLFFCFKSPFLFQFSLSVCVCDDDDDD